MAYKQQVGLKVGINGGIDPLSSTGDMLRFGGQVSTIFSNRVLESYVNTDAYPAIIAALLKLAAAAGPLFIGLLLGEYADRHGWLSGQVSTPMVDGAKASGRKAPKSDNIKLIPTQQIVSELTRSTNLVTGLNAQGQTIAMTVPSTPTSTSTPTSAPMTMPVPEQVNTVLPANFQ